MVSTPPRHLRVVADANIVRPGGQERAVRAFAPAKINLYLHVVGRRPDGYHLLDSLVVFADIGDWVTARPGAQLSLAIDGPEASALADSAAPNLVVQAARRLGQILPTSAPGAALQLEKTLPVSSGIGGGSSDAAATLRSLLGLWRQTIDPVALADLALQLGADTPACLVGTPVWVGGIGERLEPAGDLPMTGIVLVNPRRALSTPAVFKARRGDFSREDRFRPIPANAAGLAAILAERRNDLTEPAIVLVPEIAEVLRALELAPGTLLARMSGSGATCFALFADRDSAQTAAEELARLHPAWWITAGALTNRPPAVMEISR